MKLALIGYGNVGRALMRLLTAQHARFPFTVTGIHIPPHSSPRVRMCYEPRP